MKAASEKGFSLIELLIVAAMLGFVMGAIYSIYQTHQRSAYVQEDVVEVQQNLRIAMETMTRDIRNSGMLIPAVDNAATANNVENSAIGSAAGDTIYLNSASGNGKYAMIAVDQEGIITAFTVDSAESVDAFFAGEYVRIMRAFNRSQPTGGVNGTVFQIETVDRGSTVLPVADPTIKLQYVSGEPADTITFKKGDMIVGVQSGAALFPSSIRYFLDATLATCPAGQTCLVRRTDEGTAVEVTQVVATNITGMQLSYIQDNGIEVAVPADVLQVQSVRVTITGATADTVRLSDGIAKTREVSSVIALRNR